MKRSNGELNLWNDVKHTKREKYSDLTPWKPRSFSIIFKPNAYVSYVSSFQSISNQQLHLFVRLPLSVLSISSWPSGAIIEVLLCDPTTDGHSKALNNFSGVGPQDMDSHHLQTQKTTRFEALKKFKTFLGKIVGLPQNDKQIHDIHKIEFITTC